MSPVLIFSISRRFQLSAILIFIVALDILNFGKFWGKYQVLDHPHLYLNFRSIARANEQLKLDVIKSHIIFTRQLLLTLLHKNSLWLLYMGHLTNWLNCFMEQSPSWETANCATTQELPRILRNLKVHYCVHMNSLLTPVLSRINPVHITPFYFSEVHFNNILQPTSSLLSDIES
jgi:hypothetical protein